MKESNYFLDGLINKDEFVIRDIYKNIFPNVLKFVLNNSGKQEDAEDVFQKALLQIMARVSARQFEIKSSFEAYLFVACKNLWRRELNKQKKVVTNNNFLEQISEEQEMAMSVLEQERWEFFQEKLELISDNCKNILKKFFNKVPYKVIDKDLNYLNESVVRQRVFKCKKKLAQLIKTDTRFKELKEI